eukprot:Hpha_TRINITY_DN13218_c0_g3::TRINITY_DN13218_c0_g3_i1::g.154947::m.154947/K03469/rnhA, RNASEH1; ribonuclease HI
MSGWGARTAQRAELAAFLRVIVLVDGPVEVRTDSSYVVEGVRTLRFGWEQRGWFQRPAMARWVPNADLWFAVHTCLAFRAPGTVKVVKVKGHATEAMVDAGEVDAVDVWGNAGADWVAQYAARNCNSG